MGRVGRQAGFTLVEMVMVIVIAGILAIGTTAFITNSVGGYVDVARRQELANIGLVAAEKIGRELRNALPNSIRTFTNASGDACLEFIPIIDGSTYVSIPLEAPGATGFQAAPSGRAAASTGHIVVYPSNGPALYTGGSPGPRTAMAGTLPVGNGEITVSWTGNHVFASDSPTRRFFVVGTPVTYCQGGTDLYRFVGYGFQATTAQTEGALASGNRQLIVDQLAAGTLTWVFIPPNLARNAVVRIGFNLVNAQVATEIIDIQHEVQIRNVP